MLVKVKSYRIRQSGRGLILTLPQVWTDDLDLKPGDKLDVYRDSSDRLVIMSCKKTGGIASYTAAVGE